MTKVAPLIRAARKSKGLSQAQLADRTRVYQSRVSRAERDTETPSYETVDRLLGGAGHRLYSAPTRRDDAATLAADIREALRRGDRLAAIRSLVQLNDNLVAEHGLIRGVLCVAEPAPTGEAVWDAAVAGLVAWRLDDERLPHPAWVDDGSRRLALSRGLDIDRADPVPGPADVPAAFAERGVLVWGDTFASV